jgi:hypothetical protein
MLQEQTGAFPSAVLKVASPMPELMQYYLVCLDYEDGSRQNNLLQKFE